jgi:hypothetical protein
MITKIKTHKKRNKSAKHKAKRITKKKRMIKKRQKK